MLAVCAALGFVLSGCYKLDSTTVINDDGSGTIELIFGVDSALLELSDLAQEPPEVPTREELCEELFVSARAEAGASALSPYDDGRFCGVKINAEVAASDDPGAALASAMQITPESSIGALSIAKGEDGGWVFSHANISEVIGESARVAAPGVDADEAAGFESLIGASAEARYSVSLPGSAVPTANNATSTSYADGRTVFVWQMDAARLPDLIEARTVPATDAAATGGTATNEAPESLAATDDDGGNGPLLVAMAALLATLAIGGSVMINRSKADTKPSS